MNNSNLSKDVNELIELSKKQDLILGCHCKPKPKPCHVDIIKEFIDKQNSLLRFC